MTNTKQAPESLTRAGKVTIYFKSEFLGNVVKVEAKQIEIKVRSYAQYSQAVEFRYRKPRQRRDRGAVQTYQPSLLVLDGWNHPEPGESFRTIAKSADAELQQARYSSCDPRWESDFDALIAEHIEQTGARVLADFRGHNAA